MSSGLLSRGARFLIWGFSFHRRQASPKVPLDQAKPRQSLSAFGQAMSHHEGPRRKKRLHQESSQPRTPASRTYVYAFSLLLQQHAVRRRCCKFLSLSKIALSTPPSGCSACTVLTILVSMQLTDAADGSRRAKLLVGLCPVCGRSGLSIVSVVLFERACWSVPGLLMLEC